MSGVHRGFAILGATAIGVASWVGGAADARACSCAGEWALIVPFGAEHPRGAALVFESSCGGSLAGWSVTVDGMAASLGAPVVDGEIATVPIEPLPAVGAEVVVMVDCVGRESDPECGVDDTLDERARFTIGPPDTSAPPPALEVVFEVLPNEDESCFSAEEHRMIETNVEIDEREPGTWIDLELRRADGMVIAHTGRAMPEDGSLTTLFLAHEDGLAAPEVCLTAAVQDASGNVAAPPEDCLFGGPDGPDPSLFHRGCRCTAGTEHGWDAALLGLFALMFRRRRS